MINIISHNIILMLLIYVLIIITLYYGLSLYVNNDAYENYAYIHNPFNKDFYMTNVITDVHSFGIMPNEFTNSFANFIARPIDKIIYMSDDNTLIKKLQDKTIDFAILLSESITHNHEFYFIAALSYAYINILCTDDSGIINMSDIKDNIIINVHSKDSIHHKSCVRIIHYLHLDKYVSYVFDNTKAEMYYYITSTPSNYIRRLTDSKRMHFVSIDKLNSGNIYYNTEPENNFYNTYKQYEKGLLDVTKLFIYYPNITIIDKNKLYVNTLKMQYILVSGQEIDIRCVNEYFRFILFNLEQRNSPIYTNIYLQPMQEITPMLLENNRLKIRNIYTKY